VARQEGYRAGFCRRFLAASSAEELRPMIGRHNDRGFIAGIITSNDVAGMVGRTPRGNPGRKPKII
jgi:hypothetical protein